MAMHLIHSFLFMVRISDEVDVHHKTVLDLNGSKNIVAFNWNYGGHMNTNCAKLLDSMGVISEVVIAPRHRSDDARVADYLLRISQWSALLPLQSYGDWVLVR